MFPLIRNPRGQTLVSVMLSVAISAIMMVVMMQMTDNLNKSSREFKKTTSRTLFEMQTVGSLSKSTICSCNFAGRSLPVGGAPVDVLGLSSSTVTCPTPAAAPRDLYLSSPNGFDLEGGLRVRRISIRDVQSISGTDYQGRMRIEYQAADGIQIKDQDLYFYFTRDTVNPASTATNPLVSTCTVSSSEASPAANAEGPQNFMAGICNQTSRCAADWRSSITYYRCSLNIYQGTTSSVRAPATSVPAGSRGTQQYSQCGCQTGYTLVLVDSDVSIQSGPNDRTSDIQVTRNTYMCMKN